MNLTQRDKKHLWHPLTQHKLHPDTIGITKAKGALLYGENGETYIDGIASWYTCMFGHCNDYIIQKLQEQLKELDHVIFTGFTHEPAVSLSETLMEILPSNQQKMFFSDNGSTAVDVALKMALQYHHNRGDKKNVILAFEEGFHGDTFGAMSVSGLSVYNGPFEDFFIEVKRIPTPDEQNIEGLLKDLHQLIADYNIAAFIYEPLVQGAAAMKMYSPQLLEQLLSITKENNILNIADEVMTGFGKTGRHFASDHVSVKPDIICLAKSLTGGVLPMALTTCSQEVFDTFYDEDMTKGFFHGHTYSANPIACTAALAATHLLVTEEMQNNIRRIEQKHQAFDKKIQSHPLVKSSRQLGVIYALEINTKMSRYGSMRDQLFQFYLNNGVFLRPLGNVVYILPPFVISDQQLDKVYETIEQSLDMLS